MAKTVNMTAVAEWRRKDGEYKGRLGDLESVTLERDEARQAYEDLRRRRLEDFMTGFGDITLKLKEMYQMITLGGDAELELVDSLDPFSEGIVFSVCSYPPSRPSSDTPSPQDTATAIAAARGPHARTRTCTRAQAHTHAHAHLVLFVAVLELVPFVPVRRQEADRPLREAGEHLAL